MDRSEWEEELKMDYYAEQAEALQEFNLQHTLRTDYEKFRDYFEDKFTDAIDALQELKRVHEEYEQEFVLKDLEDELC